MWEAGLEELEIHIPIIHNTEVQYIETVPILDPCLESERRT